MCWNDLPTPHFLKCFTQNVITVESFHSIFGADLNKILLWTQILVTVNLCSGGVRLAGHLNQTEMENTTQHSQGDEKMNIIYTK